MENKKYGKYTLPIIIDLANKYGVDYLLNDTYSGNSILLKFDKANIALWDFPFNINHSASIKICTNKDVCTSFLGRLGFNVPISNNFTRRSTEKNTDLIPMMNDFLNNLHNYGINYPIILKPSNLSQGTGIVKINNFEEAQSAFKNLNNFKTKTFILQEFVKGNDYRVVVLNGEVIQAYERIPFSITGNNKDSIYNLIEYKTSQFEYDNRDKPVDINDARIWNCVKNAGYSPFDILPKDKTIRLQDIANLSLGGSSIDHTKTITPFFKNLCAKISKSLGLELCGIDILTDNISDTHNRSYSILEINSAPGLDNYLYSDHDKQEQYVNSLYEKIFVYLLNKYSNKQINNLEEFEERI